MNITFFGATGMLGKPVAKQFIKSGHNLKMLVRNKNKAKSIFGDFPEYVEGNLESDSAVKQSLEGSEAVYINLSVAPGSNESDFQPEREGIEKIINLSKGMGIKLISNISSVVKNYNGMDGFNWWVFDLKENAEKMIKNSGINYLIFQPSSFMENFDIGGFKQGKKINLAGESKYPMYFISGDDYGKQVVKAFENFDGQSKVYIVQGPEAYKTNEAADIFVKNYKKENLKISKAPFWLLKFIGIFSSKMKYVSNIVYSLNNYPEKFEAEKTWEELGKPEETLEHYAKSRK